MRQIGVRQSIRFRDIRKDDLMCLGDLKKACTNRIRSSLEFPQRMLRKHQHESAFDEEVLSARLVSAYSESQERADPTSHLHTVTRGPSRVQATAHCSDRTSACSRTVWVAFSCLSGG